ncbi:MAG: Inner membrane protein YebE [Syntrophaceae bacterium PtaB.Bin095]|uniref:Hypothetical cytosolic protein n=1 Tax=Syntrophus aciditrophicus (strain SB) TaxID=56780 RepID=Q2LYB4_SYNAS|nr:tellurite resistance TerB family protein [Syntrophus aciditrophicus]ABC75904.1 hypothetical cytosolic protein [Syntrophus aciditrophicus SB]OPY07376.1 MAG: Inner membrane protein YebE [Syntrophaceae bacterium PtaB.Bin095]
MKITELLGAMVQAGMAPSSNDRMKNSLGGGNVLDNLAGMMGGSTRQPGGGGLGDILSGVLGGGKSGGGGIGDLLSNMLGDAGKEIGSNKNIAIGGLGALIGSLLGGGGKSLGGAVGGGLMALLGTLAFNALKGSGQSKPQLPVGLLEPQTDEEQQALEQTSELVLRAMINATKADGEIDQDEINRIVGKFEEIGVDEEGRRYVMNQLRQPMETEELIAAAKGQPELAVQIYAASLLAVEVDTQAEKDYLDQLAAGLGLTPQLTERIQQMIGLQQA